MIMKSATIFLFPLALLCSPLHAQDTPSQDAPAPASAAVAPAAPGESGVESGQKLDFLKRANLVSAKLLEDKRVIDPFGMLMDPANVQEVPVVAEEYEEVEETPVLTNSSLKTALLTLPITGIYPQRGLIVIGARSFKVGGQLGMKLQDLTIRLRFEGVRGSEVFFKDMETQEIASIPFNTRPKEFEPLTNSSSHPLGAGIIPMNELFIVN